MPTATLFTGYVIAIAALVAALLLSYLPARAARTRVAGLFAWLIYAGVLGYSGVVGDASLVPPGPAFLLVPVFLFVALFLARSPQGERLALSFPLAVLVAVQVFRVGVEMFLHQLWQDGLMPRMLTFSGGNPDIIVGASAPIMAWLYARRHVGERLLLAWNVIGLCTLANVAVRALLTAPGALNLVQSDVPNLAIGTFPFTFIPGFLAPLALVLHVLAIRAIRSGHRLATEP